MPHSETYLLTASDIQAIELRARALRSQAMAHFLRAGGARLAKAAQKIGSLFQRPRHA